MDEPGLRPTPELVDTLTAGLVEAIDVAVSTSSVARPFVVEYRLGDTTAAVVETYLPGGFVSAPRASVTICGGSARPTATL